MLLEAIGLALAFLAVVLLVIEKVNYGLALTIGALILGVFSYLSPIELLHVLAQTLTDEATIDLTVIVSLIPILAYCMKETGMIDDLIEGIKKALLGRNILAILPALMGALPMIGGALLSAPLIDEEAERLGLNRNEKSFVNVWFRHWNFFIYPLSSPLILLAGLTGFSLYTLILMNLIPVALYLTLGYLVSIRRIREDSRPNKPGKPGSREALVPVLLGVSPILLTVTLNLLGLHMALSLAAGIFSTFLLRKTYLKKAFNFMRDGFDWRLPFAILGVMYFRNMVNYTNVFSKVYPYLNATGLPLLFLLLLIGWTIGLATAMPSAGIAIVFPIAIASGDALSLTVTGILYSTLVFAYLISPMHLCLILTVEYYKARLQTVYRKLVPMACIAYACFVVSHIILGKFLS